MTPFTFQMPYLSRYTMCTDGTVFSHTTNQYVTVYFNKNIGTKVKYYLVNDYGEREYVYIKEIQLYGEHLQFTESIKELRVGNIKSVK